MTVPSLEEAVERVMQLPAVEKLRLAERLLKTVERELPSAPVSASRPTYYGVLAGVGPAPDAEAIDEMRREVWANFPREDI
jgi:hypothetical protein